MSPFPFGVTTLAGTLGGRGVMNPKSTQTLWLHVGTESYVAITWEDFSKVSQSSFDLNCKERGCSIAHMYSDLRKREKIGILLVVTVSSFKY